MTPLLHAIPCIYVFFSFFLRASSVSPLNACVTRYLMRSRTRLSYRDARCTCIRTRVHALRSHVHMFKRNRLMQIAIRDPYAIRSVYYGVRLLTSDSFSTARILWRTDVAFLKVRQFRTHERYSLCNYFFFLGDTLGKSLEFNAHEGTCIVIIYFFMVPLYKEEYIRTSIFRENTFYHANSTIRSQCLWQNVRLRITRRSSALHRKPCRKDLFGRIRVLSAIAMACESRNISFVNLYGLSSWYVGFTIVLLWRLRNRSRTQLYTSVAVTSRSEMYSTKKGP